MLTDHEPLRVAVLCSSRAPGLLHLVDRERSRGCAYQIVCVITSERTFVDEVRIVRRGVPVRSHPIREFYEVRGASVYRDLDVRAEFDARTAEILAASAPDLVLLAGYLYRITSPLLDAYARRLLNLHFSDLTVRDTTGRPQFPGIRAVRDTLAAGFAETRATIHLVNEELDAGAPLVRSWPFPVSPMVHDARRWGAADMFKAYAFAHQHWMLRAASGPMWGAALRLVAEGTLDLDDVAARPPRRVAPWDLDRHGVLLAPRTTRWAPADTGAGASA